MRTKTTDKTTKKDGIKYVSLPEANNTHLLTNDVNRFAPDDMIITSLQLGHISKVTQTPIIHKQGKYIVSHHTGDGFVCIDVQRIPLAAIKPTIALVKQWVPHRKQMDLLTWIVRTYHTSISDVIVTIPAEAILTWKGGNFYHDYNEKKPQKVSRKKRKEPKGKRR